MINLNNFPSYTEQHYTELVSAITPVERDELGYLIKRDDYFSLGGIKGGKVRQALGIVHDNLEKIRKSHNGGIITGAGLPSPQTCITAGVAKYFSLKCAVVTFKYNGNPVDYNRINVSLAQRLGADVYGAQYPRKSFVEKYTRDVASDLGFYQLNFGMSGRRAISIVSEQCINIPDNVETIVVTGGSGFSALGVALGLKKFGKNVKRIIVICLSRYAEKNKVLWYDPLPWREKFDGDFVIIRSDIPYANLYNPYGDYRYDLTYESKAYHWLTNNLPPDDKVMFWVVGIREYDLGYIEPIHWKSCEIDNVCTQKLF